MLHFALCQPRQATHRARIVQRGDTHPHTAVTVSVPLAHRGSSRRKLATRHARSATPAIFSRSKVSQHVNAARWGATHRRLVTLSALRADQGTFRRTWAQQHVVRVSQAALPLTGKKMHATIANEVGMPPTTRRSSVKNAPGTKCRFKKDRHDVNRATTRVHLAGVTQHVVPRTRVSVSHAHPDTTATAVALEPSA